MTGIDKHDEMHSQDGSGDAPGWGLPSPDPDTPAPVSRAGDDDAALTPVQQAVVSEVAEGQRALGHEMQWRRRSTLDLFAGGGGGVAGYLVDSALASQDANGVAASERDAVNSGRDGRISLPILSHASPPAAHRHPKRFMMRR